MISIFVEIYISTLEGEEHVRKAEAVAKNLAKNLIEYDRGFMG